MPIVSGGGGGSQPANWCLISFTTPAALSLGNDTHQFPAVEMHIIDQAGSDFSVGTQTGHGAVLSAGGGMFQVGAGITPPVAPVLDAGSTALRWLWFLCVVGPGSGLGQLGYNSLAPIFPSGTDNGPGAALQTVASLPGIVPPGGAAIYNPTINLVGGVGVDSIPLDAVFSPSFGMCAVWQVAA